MAWKAINKNTGQVAGIFSDEEKKVMELNLTYSGKLRFVEIPDGPKPKDAEKPKEEKTPLAEPVESKKA
jgi:hypothetical protein